MVDVWLKPADGGRRPLVFDGILEEVGMPDIYPTFNETKKKKIEM